MVKETETDICSLRDTFAFCLHRWKNGIDKKLWPTCRRPRVHHAHRQSLRQPALEMASRASDWQHRRGYELLLRGRSEVSASARMSALSDLPAVRRTFGGSIYGADQIFCGNIDSCASTIDEFMLCAGRHSRQRGEVEGWRDGLGAT